MVRVSITLVVIGIFISSLNLGHTATAQQQPQQQQTNTLNGTAFRIDNITFSHHLAIVNGIQMHYVIGGQGNPIVLLMDFQKHGTNGVMSCHLWQKIILS